MKIFEQIDNWHQSKLGLAVFATVEFVGAAAFIYWALTGGSWLDWLCALILISGGIQNFVRLIWKTNNA